MDVSENSGFPKSSILIGFSIIHHPFWGTTIFGNTHMNDCDCEFAFSSNPKGILFENPRSRYASGRETPMSGCHPQNLDKHSARNNRKKNREL